MNPDLGGDRGQLGVGSPRPLAGESSISNCLPFPCMTGGLSDSKEDEEDGLKRSHDGSSTDGWEELSPAGKNGVAEGLRVDVDIGEVTSVKGGWRDGPPGSSGGGEGGGQGSLILLQPKNKKDTD
jgi:hypothetical protein